MKKIILSILCLLCCLSVFAADFDFAKPYNKKLDKAGTVLQLATMATSGILLAEKPKEYPLIGTMYIETIGLTFGAKELLKNLIPRNRPYTYFTDAPIGEMADWAKSFPSGHAAYAFAAATFTSYVFCKYNPISKAKIPVCAASYGLAFATSFLRVASGNHFSSDVLAGAILGSAIGFAVPYIHTLFVKENFSVSVSPFSFAFRISLK